MGMTSLGHRDVFPMVSACVWLHIEYDYVNHDINYQVVMIP